MVYNTLFPNPSPSDPQSFSAHLTKNLVGEVRVETATFYGSLDTIEARYPGLNYAHPPHRKRLGRFPHHKRLFEAFDKLGLTESEIQGFCRWEGTLWARERYERDEGVKVRDTTAEEIGEWVDTRKKGARNGAGSKGINVKTDIEVEIAEVTDEDEQAIQRHLQLQAANPSSSSVSRPNMDTEMHDDNAAESEEDDDAQDDDDDDADMNRESVGFALNQRLLQAAALRERGVEDVIMDPEWEQFLKEAQERGDLSIEGTREALRIMASELARRDQLVQIARGQAVSSGQSQSPAAPA
jgi:hypothetical protein